MGRKEPFRPWPTDKEEIPLFIGILAFIIWVISLIVTIFVSFKVLFMLIDLFFLALLIISFTKRVAYIGGHGGGIAVKWEEHPIGFAFAVFLQLVMFILFIGATIIMPWHGVLN